MFWRIKRCFVVLGALLVVLATWLFACGVRAVKITLESPELLFLSRSFYLYTPSSQAEIKQKLAWYEWSEIEGESAEYEILEGAGMDSLAFARQKCKELGGEELFVEEVDGVSSVYAYAPEFYEGIVLCGVRVNLHVAVRGDRVVVGSPIIFGGF